jgi:peptidoglycan/LPS O-acetylase OafA/YrhL
MSQSPINLRTLDMLRGVLAVYVLVGHCRWLLWSGHAVWMAAPHSRWLEPVVYASASFRYGREAVMIFFVLSGLFIHLRAAQDTASTPRPIAAGAFYRRRAHRLGAPYAVALIVTVALDAIGRQWFPVLYQAATGDALVDGVFDRTGYQWQSIAPALVVLPSSLGYDFGTNGPLWSLAYEVVYYALYPAWLAVRRRSVLLAYVAVPLACLSLFWLRSGAFPVVVLIYYPVWLTGAALAEVLTRRRAPVSLAGAALLFAAGGLLHVTNRGHIPPAVPAILFGGGAVLLCASMGAEAVRWAPVRWFEYFGARSYSIYITHFPLVALMSAVLFASPAGRPFHGWYAIGGAAAAIAFGCVCFELCERHFVHHRIPTAKLAA